MFFNSVSEFSQTIDVIACKEKKITMFKMTLT
jgi:hypothetical protein